GRGSHFVVECFAGRSLCCRRSALSPVGEHPCRKPRAEPPASLLRQPDPVYIAVNGALAAPRGEGSMEAQRAPESRALRVGAGDRGHDAAYAFDARAADQGYVATSRSPFLSTLIPGRSQWRAA